MKKISLSVFYCFFLLCNIFSQEDLPTDYLSAAFHAGRRDEARKLMPAHSVMAVFAYPERRYSNDVNYTYHPNPDLYYFTGYKEPHALLLIFKEPQRYKDSITYNELFFIQKKNAQAEQWTGRRLGTEGVKKELGFTLVFNGEDFNRFPIDLSGFSRIIFDVLPEDAGSGNNAGDLPRLIASFRETTHLPANYDPVTVQALNNIYKYQDSKNTAGINKYLASGIEKGRYKNTDLVNEYIKADSTGRKAIIAKLADEKWNSVLFTSITTALREIKTPEELLLLRKAVEISSIGHAEVMKAMRADMSEREIEGIHDYVQKKYGAEHWGYPPIVGAGNNGCILHYEENNKMSVGQKMLLMDVGGEYHGYSADVTRTVPVNGVFSPEQKIIYNIVYNAQEEAFKHCKEGTAFDDIEDIVRKIISDGLIKIGLIKNAEDVGKYYPHGCSHHIGLDVHDKGFYEKLKKNMVITMEPGIYIPEGSDCDKKWWGIAVRIEDDLLIKEKDYELLSAAAPRKAEEIEKMVAEKSGFDDIKLPALKSGKKDF